MPVAKNQIGELVDVIESFVGLAVTVKMLERLSNTHAAIQNIHFAGTVDRMLTMAQNRLNPEQNPAKNSLQK